MAEIKAFLMDCRDDNKLEYLSEVYGDVAFLVYVKLRQYIHSEHGYYCKWGEDYITRLFLRRRFSTECTLDLEDLNTIVDGAIRAELV